MITIQIYTKILTHERNIYRSKSGNNQSFDYRKFLFQLGYFTLKSIETNDISNIQNIVVISLTASVTLAIFPLFNRENYD